MRGLVLVLAVLTSLRAGAGDAPPTPHDFALGLPIEHDPTRPYFEVTLPPLVYRTATDAALADLRFFDADGRELRYADLSAAPPATTAGTQSARVELPLFPLSRDAYQLTGTTSEVRIAADGRLATITQAGTSATTTTVYAYLVDVSAVRERVRRFHLEVAGDAADVVPYAIDGSTDLNTWNTLAPRLNLVRLEHAGRRIEQSEFSIDNARYPYLRVRWLAPAQAPRIAAVRATLTDAGAPAALERLEVSATRVASQPRTLAFDSGGRYPIREVALMLTANRVMSGELQAAIAPQGPWQTVRQGDWYALRVGEVTVRSVPIEVQRRGYRYWRFVASEGEVIDEPLPALAFAWAPQVYRVLAEGRAPYLLAVGSTRVSAQAAARALPARALADGTVETMSAAAVLGAPVALGGDERLRERPRALPWQRIALWSALVIGVAVIAGMALNLYRDMGRSRG